MKIFAAFVSMAISLLVAAGALAADVSLSDKGIGMTVKGMGSFNLGYPTLQPGDLKPVQKKVSGNKAELTYAGEVAISVEVTGEKVTLKFKNAKELKTLGMSMPIGGQYGEGGTWMIGKAEAKPFPAQKPAKPHLFQGHAGAFTFTDASGHTLSVSGFPEYAYQELTDLREWGTMNFSWRLSLPLNQAQYTLLISETPNSASAAAPSKAKVLVDRFGQSTIKEFPGKVKDEADLKADVANEAAYWASYQPMAVDKWGGLPGSKEKLGLQATGFFRVEKKNDKWLLVNPDGNLTFHLGVCVFGYNPGDETTYIKDRHEIFEWLPPLGGRVRGGLPPGVVSPQGQLLLLRGQCDSQVWSHQQG